MEDEIIHGDCIEEMKKMKADSIDTIITDPPYGLEFMGKKWDYDVPSVELWKEALRVLKPGGTALIFAGSRTQHRMAVNIEDAGFILKDTIMWLYGSGFPKATDISKQLDKGVERKVVGYDKNSAPDLRDVGKMSKEAMGIDKLSFGQNPRPAERKQVELTKATTPEAKLWNGWKSHGLKPAYEPILVAMKPNDGTYAANSQKWGVAGLNIDGGRISGDMGKDRAEGKPRIDTDKYGKANPVLNPQSPLGRFPSNIILDEEAGKMLDEQSGESKSHSNKLPTQNDGGVFGGGGFRNASPDDKGGASRFFYCAKSSRSERNQGLDSIVLVDILRVWKEESITKEEKLTRLMVTGLSPQKVTEEFGTQKKGDKEWSTFLFGKELTEQYQKDTGYIIKTEINSITVLEIWNYLMHLLTKGYIQDVKLETGSGGNLADSVEQFASLVITINEKTALALGVKNVVSLTQLRINVKEGSNIHPTCKPLALMEYLVTLTSTPTGGIVLDPFAGSGTTLIACKSLGRPFIGIERELEYIKIVEARLKAVPKTLFQ